MQHPRTHSHSLSVGALNPSHRVSRRKSTSASAVNNHAAMVAALREASAGGSYNASGIGTSSGSAKRAGASKSPGAKHHASNPSLPSSLPSHASVFGANSYTGKEAKTGVAVADGPSLSVMVDKEKGKARVRRASDGSRLSKADKRNNAAELKCETCGKAYKHSSCLTKHLWVSPSSRAHTDTSSQLLLLPLLHDKLGIW